MPQRIAFFDGVRSEKKCEKLLSKNECKKLNSQMVEKYKIYAYRKNKNELRPNSILEVPKSFIK